MAVAESIAATLPLPGATLIVEADRVTALPIASHEMIHTVRQIGRRALAATSRATAGWT